MPDDTTAKGLFAVHDFARLSRTTKDTLLHYDRIGLLSPVKRGDNNYRYYSSSQLTVVNVIRTFQELGMTLGEIKALKDQRSPEDVSEKLLVQIERIDAKIEEWVKARKLLFTLRSTIKGALGVEEETVSIQYLPSEAIILGDLNDYSRGRQDYDALFVFYNRMQERYPDLNPNYPVWGTFSEARVKANDWHWPDRFYFFNPEGYDKRPASLYAIGYTRGGYGEFTLLAGRILNYISANGFEVSGDAYVEYPHNEFSVTDPRNYLIRVMIMVRERAKTSSP